MITLLSFAGCFLAMTGSLLLALGKVRAVMALGIVTHSVFIVLNIAIAYRTEAGAAVLAIPSVWAILMNILGLRRRNDADSATEPTADAV